MKNPRLMVLLAFSFLLAIGAIIGCGTVGDGFLIPGNPFFQPRFVFVYNYICCGNDSVSAFSIDAGTGALTAGPNSPVTLGIPNNCCGARFLGVDPNSRFLYVPLNTSPGGVLVYFVDQTSGKLTAANNGTPVPTGKTCCSWQAVADPSGRFVYVIDFTSAPNLFAFTVGGDGKLTSVDAGVNAGPDPIGIAMDPLGRFVFVVDCGSSCNNPDTVTAFSIDQVTGKLTQAGSAVQTGPYPRTPLVDPSGRYLYVVNMNRSQSAGQDTVSAFSIAANGNLTPITNSPFTVGTGTSQPYGIALTQNGTFAYVTNKNDQNIRAFTVSGGALAQLGNPITLTPALKTFPHGTVADPSGKYILVLDSENNQVRVLSVDAAGGLAEVSGSPVPTGAAANNFPTSIVISH